MVSVDVDGIYLPWNVGTIGSGVIITIHSPTHLLVLLRHQTSRLLLSVAGHILRLCGSSLFLEVSSLQLLHLWLQASSSLASSSIISPVEISSLPSCATVIGCNAAPSLHSAPSYPSCLHLLASASDSRIFIHLSPRQLGFGLRCIWFCSSLYLDSSSMLLHIVPILFVWPLQHHRWLLLATMHFVHGHLLGCLSLIRTASPSASIIRPRTP